MVLLCFDTQSQQATEFGKVARWVRKFNKPVIAVLNVRNPRWRHSALMRSEQARRALSRSVAEHVGNVRTELARIDLVDVPIVAYHGRRALAARAAMPFAGPSAAGLEVERERFGIEYLAESSNIEVLEQLMTGAIVGGAGLLRSGAMRDTLRGATDDLEAAHDRALEITVEPIAELDREVSALLDVLGYPTGLDRARRLGSSADLLAAGECARGAGFPAKPHGTAARHFRHLLDSRLAGPQRKVLADVEKLVSAKIDKEESATVADLDEVLARHRPDIEKAIQTAWDAAGRYVYRKVELGLDSSNAGSAERLAAEEDIAAENGLKGVVGWALRAVGVAGAVAAAAVPVAAANFWNPAGWAVGAAAIVIGGAGAIASKFGDDYVKGSERDKAAYKRRTLATARELVTTAFDAIEKDLRLDFDDQLWSAASDRLTELLTELIAAHDYASAIRVARERLRISAERIGAAPDVTAVLAAATADVVARRSAEAGRSLTASEVWLGEDWFTRVISSASAARADGELTARYRETAANDTVRLANWISRVWAPIGEQELERWEADAAAILESAGKAGARSLGSDVGAPAIVIIGDYSAGKSSLIKRLLAELDATTTETIGISGGAKTDAVSAYDVGGVRLIDTPGFQSGRTEHDRVAVEASVAAALIVVVLQVNLMVGDSSLVEQIISGNDLMRAKGQRVLFVINRADELGSDPIIGPEEFAQRKRLKRDELRQALSGREIEISDDQIHFVAGDPFGQYAHVADVTSADFDEHRLWDGIDALTGAFREISRTCAEWGAARASVDVTCNALSRNRVAHAQEIKTSTDMIEMTRAAAESLENALADSAELGGAIRGRIGGVITHHADAAVDRIRGCGPDDMKDVDAAVQDWLDDGLRADLTRMITAYNAEVEELIQEHAETIGREFDILESEIAAGIGTGHNSTHDGAVVNAVVDAGAGFARFGSAMAKALGNRDAVYAIGKFAGWKFKPWGAVKGGAAVAKAAPILGAVAVALEGFSMYSANQSEQKRDERKRDAEQRVRSDAAEYLRELLDGDPSTACSVLRTFAESVEETQKELTKTITAAEDGVAEHRVSVQRIDDLLLRATAITTTSEEK